MGQAAAIGLNTFLGLVPDLAIAWAVSQFTESGMQGFWYTLIVNRPGLIGGSNS